MFYFVQNDSCFQRTFNILLTKVSNLLNADIIAFSESKLKVTHSVVVPNIELIYGQRLRHTIMKRNLKFWTHIQCTHICQEFNHFVFIIVNLLGPP